MEERKQEKEVLQRLNCYYIFKITFVITSLIITGFALLFLTLLL